jgi:hypothetical protein
VVEGAALEKQYAGNRIVGSNPTLSATSQQTLGALAIQNKPRALFEWQMSSPLLLLCRFAYPQTKRQDLTS